MLQRPRLLARWHLNALQGGLAVVLIVVWGIGAGAPVQAQDPVVPRIMPQLRTLSVTTPTFQAPLQIAPRDRQVFTVTLDAAGALRARATWSGADRLALILNGPGQTGYYAREDGSSPLSLTFTVTDELLERGAEWTLSVVNFGSGGPPAEGTLAVTLPRPEAPAAPATEEQPEAQPQFPERAAPGVVRTLQRPELLQDGSMRFALPNGAIAQLSPSDTLTVVDPEAPDTIQTFPMMDTNVQPIDPPVPPDELTADPDLSTWWSLMQMWMEGMNGRMRDALAQAFTEASMQQFEQAESEADIESPFDRADYRLRFLERVLISLLVQTSGDEGPPTPNNE